MPASYHRSPLSGIQVVLVGVQRVVVKDQGRLILDVILAIHSLGQLRKGFDARALAGFCRRLFHAFLYPFGACHATCQRENGLHIEVVVPDIQVVHQGKLLHMLTVTLQAPHRSLPALLSSVAILSTSDDHAGCQSFDIPFPGPFEGLIEVVHIEDLPALRGGKDAKVAQMRITTELRLDA